MSGRIRRDPDGGGVFLTSTGRAYAFGPTADRLEARGYELAAEGRRPSVDLHVPMPDFAAPAPPAPAATPGLFGLDPGEAAERLGASLLDVLDMLGRGSLSWDLRSPDRIAEASVEQVEAERADHEAALAEVHRERPVEWTAGSTTFQGSADRDDDGSTALGDLLGGEQAAEVRRYVERRAGR